MSEKSQIACESMKKLTEKVITSDLAFRKRLYIKGHAYAMTKVSFLPIAVIALYNLYTPYGKLYEVNRQSGDSLNLLKFVFGDHRSSLREIFRPEIYYRDQALKMKSLAYITQTEISKNDQVVFKPYIWN